MERFFRFGVYGSILTVILFFLIVLVACSPATTEDEEVIEAAKADAGPIQSSYVGKAVQLDASDSSGTGISYHWLLRSTPEGSEARLLEFESAQPFFLADQPGTYVAQLIVMDKANGTSKDFTTVSINTIPTTPVTIITDVHVGITDSCQTCHNGSGATGKPGNHIESTNECAVCHGTDAWTPNIAIDHNEILGTCTTCHNGIRAPGKPLDHIETTAECNLCHNAGTTFTVAIMPVVTLDDEEHPPIGNMMCMDCHNNVIEEGKPADHIPASDNCENCHNTMDWDIAGAGGSGSGESVDDGDESESREDDDDDDDESGDHPPIGNMMCVECHNNVIEEGKEDDHILTTDVCEACHNTNDWEPVMTVDHVQVIGVCSSCHDNDTAQGKPRGHIETMEECNACHSTTGWTPLIAGGGGGTGGGVGNVDHSGFTQATVCMDCHNGSVATGKPNGHVITSSDCDVCHMTTTWVITP